MALTEAEASRRVSPGHTDRLRSDNFWFSVRDGDACALGVNCIHDSGWLGYLEASTMCVIECVLRRHMVDRLGFASVTDTVPTHRVRCRYLTSAGDVSRAATRPEVRCTRSSSGRPA